VRLVLIMPFLIMHLTQDFGWKSNWPLSRLLHHEQINSTQAIIKEKLLPKE
jgi:hypothetical protein